MLSFLSLIFFLFKNIEVGNAEASCRTSSETSLQTNLVEELAREKEIYQILPSLDNVLKTNELSKNSCYARTIETLQKESLQKVQGLTNTEEFQEIVTELQIKLPSHVNNSKSADTVSKAELLVFVSFSIGEKALLNLAYEAKRFGATLILRGFKDGSYRKTAQVIQKIILKTGQGVLIDPELYSLFEITAVPTFILTKPFQLRAEERTQAPIHDKLQGHVSVQYALDQFSKEGDLKEEARIILTSGETP